MYRTLILVLIMIITCIPVAAQDAGSEWCIGADTQWRDRHQSPWQADSESAEIFGPRKVSHAPYGVPDH